MKTKHIIFIHGWGSGPYVWLYQLDHFKGKCYVHAPELAGYGKKNFPPVDVRPENQAGYVFDYMVDDIADFIARKKLDEVCLVGWSLGGMIGLKLAGALKNKISRLVLIGATARFVRAHDFHCAVPAFVVERIYRRMKKDFYGTLDWFYRICFSSKEESGGSIDRILKLLGDFIAPFNEKTLLCGLDILLKLDIRHLLDDIDIPALIIHGRDDRICPVGAAEFLGDRLKNAEVRLISDVGHVPFLTMPNVINGLIEDFISR